jgi:WD40 repeat protein
MDKTLIVWNMSNNPPTTIKKITFHSGAVYAVEELSSGYIVSGGADKNLFIWNPNTGSLIGYKNSAHSSSIYCLRLLPNSYFASAAVASDSSIKIWNPISMSTAITTLSGHTGSIYALEVLTSGYLISGADDSYSIVWDYNTGVQISKFRPVNNKNVYCIKELSNGSVAFGGYDASVYIWRVSDQSLVYTVSNILSGEVPCMSFVVYNNYLAVASAGVNTEVLTVNTPSNVFYTKSLQLDTSSFANCLDKICNL